MSNYYDMPKLPTAESPKVAIFVDGQETFVPGDTNLLEALKAVGIETPSICYHPFLPVSGNCRQCLVEQEGPRGRSLIISCFTPVSPGMKVFTPKTSLRVKNARKATNEFMLVNHPLDCPICDKAGECSLQANYMESGHDSRLRENIGKHYHGSPDHAFIDSKGQTRGGKQVVLGPRVTLDEERCVQCDRCVRFMRFVAGDEQLQLASRGDSTYITTFPGQELDHEYDLCVTDVCPVGALTANNFRFQQRVWMLSRTRRVTLDDSLGANLWIDHNHGKIWRLMPRCNPEVNRSWISNTSRLAYLNFDKDRLEAAPIETLQSTVFAAKKVAIVAGGACTLEDLAAIKALQESLGAKAELFGGTSIPVVEPDGISKSGDPLANRAGFKAMQVPDANLQELLQKISDFDTLITIHSDLIGEDPTFEKLKQIPNRIVLSAFKDCTANAATLAFGVKHWTEVSGSMINSLQILQKLNAAPTAPNGDLKPAYQVLFALAGIEITEVSAAWKQVQDRIPTLKAYQRDSILSTGLKLEGVV